MGPMYEGGLWALDGTSEASGLVTWGVGLLDVYIIRRS